MLAAETYKYYRQLQLTLRSKILHFLLPEVVLKGWHAPGAWLVKVWLLAVPLSHAGLFSLYAWNNDSGHESWGHTLLVYAPLIPTVVVMLISAAVGFVAIWRTRRGIPLAEQSSLAQAAAIFTTSLVIAWLLLVLLSFASGWAPPTWESDFLTAFKPLFGMISLLVLGMVMTVLSLGLLVVGAVPPTIMCYLILKQIRPSRRNFHILVAVSAVFWIATGLLGLILAFG